MGCWSLGFRSGFALVLMGKILHDPTKAKNHRVVQDLIHPPQKLIKPQTLNVGTKEWDSEVTASSQVADFLKLQTQ